MKKEELQSHLQHALQNGHEEMARHLIELGASVKELWNDEDQESPIVHAGGCGYVGVIRILLEHGCDVDAVDQIGWTALMHACSRDETEAVRVLLENGASMHHIDQRKPRRNVLMIACASGNKEIVTLLLQYGANPDEKLDRYKADDYGRQEIVDILNAFRDQKQLDGLVKTNRPDITTL